MLNTMWAVICKGKVELLEQVELPEGARVLITILSEENENQFWSSVSQNSLAAVRDNVEDDVYAQLLEE